MPPYNIPPPPVQIVDVGAPPPPPGVGQLPGPLPPNAGAFQDNFGGPVHGGQQFGGGKHGQQNFVTEYRGWQIRRAEAEPGQRYDWTNVTKFEFPVSLKDMAQRAKRTRRTRPVLAVYDALQHDSQRLQIDKLIEDQNRQETDLMAEWKLVNIEAIVRRLPGLLGKDKIVDTTQIRVILKKVRRSAPRKPPMKPTGPYNIAGENVSIYDPPPSSANAPKMPKGDMMPGGHLPPPPLPGMMPPPPPHAVGLDDRMPRPRSRARSPGPRKSRERLTKKVTKYLERMSLGDTDDSESDDSISDVEDPRGRRSSRKFKIPPPPIGRHSRHRSRSPHRLRRGSTSSFEWIDNVSSASSGSYTDATPPLSAGGGRYVKRYIERSRSRSRPRFREHRKPPSYPPPERVYPDARVPNYVRRHSDGERLPYGARYALPAAPEAPGYGYQNPYAKGYIDPGRRGSLVGGDLRPVLDAFQKGREEERHANLVARIAELERQKEDKLRRLDEDDRFRYRR